MRLWPLAALLIPAACADLPDTPGTTRGETRAPVTLTEAAATFVQLCDAPYPNFGNARVAAHEAGFTHRQKDGSAAHSSKAMTYDSSARDCAITFNSDATLSEFRTLMTDQFRATRAPDDVLAALLADAGASAGEADLYLSYAGPAGQKTGVIYGLRIAGLGPTAEYGLRITTPE